MALTKSIDFLQEIKPNNNKEWMQANKPAYLLARDEFIEFTSTLIRQMALIDETLLDLEAKSCVFRINRDIRFSKDKSPYKSNFGLFLSEGGKKSGNVGYYFHLEPGDQSFIAGGIYSPESERLAMIRQEIDYNPEPLKKIADHPSFQRLFGAIQGDTLKRAPKGYPEDHPNINLLKLKDLIVIHHVSDESIHNWKSPEYVFSVFREIKPMNDYINIAIS